MAEHNRDDVLLKLRNILLKDFDVLNVEEEMSLSADLDLDSLSIQNVFMDVEAAFDVDMPIDPAKKQPDTIAELVDFICTA